MTKEEIEQATNVAVKLSEHLDAKEQAMFVAGFQTCIKWQSENERLKAEREWISVEDKNINWPDYEVLGFDGETYMVGTLGCESNGDVFVQDDLMQLSNITHYRILTKPQPPKQ